MRDETDAADNTLSPLQAAVARAALWLLDRDYIRPATAVRVITYVMRGY